MDDSSKSDAEWVTKGLISACECFSCRNKINHKLKDNRVSILCRDICNFKPLRGTTDSTVSKLHDIEEEQNYSKIRIDPAQGIR